MKSYIRDKRSPLPTHKHTSKVMSSIKAKDTTPELFFRSLLVEHQLIGYRLHWKKVPGRPDISFTRKKIAIFINGCYWHRCPTCKLSLPKSNVKFWKNKFEKNVQRDKIKNSQLEYIGWKVFTIWECELKKNYERSKSKIKSILDEIKSS